jgi:SAM-dependent methyltransferase
MAAVIYAHPRVYNLALRALHGRVLARRYAAVSKEIGSGKRVLDVGCGSCMLAEFLDKSCSYQGMDMNGGFVSHARRRGLDVMRGDVFDLGSYPGDIDVVVLSDILHHVVPRHGELLGICKRNAAKVIVCEPFSKHGGGSGRLSAAANRFWGGLCSLRAFNSVFGDDDGINRREDMVLWDALGKAELAGELAGHGMSTREIDDYIMGVWVSGSDR